VYLVWEGVEWLANEIIRRSGGTVSHHIARQASRLFLYYHEAFHHRTECFATRLELTHRSPQYRFGFKDYYSATKGTDACLEEALANATALEEVWKKTKDKHLLRALEGYVKDNPAGYNRGVEIRDRFRETRNEFAENNHQACFPETPRKRPQIWETTPHMFDGIANIKSRVNYLIPRDSPIASRSGFRPLLPPSKLVKKLKELTGLNLLRNGGNHDVYRSASGRTVAIPRHPRDLGRGLLRKILKELNLDMGLEEFLQQ
jgi:predicted RNA binding protein YcfA (HicA-like mRNA interferase family)